MQALRRAHFLARLALAWFAMSLGVAIASPLVKPVDLQLVCSVAGAKLLVKGETGDKTTARSLDCPLCIAAGAPPPAPTVTVAFAPPLAHAANSIPAARIAALTAAPLPARGPPLH